MGWLSSSLQELPDPTLPLGTIELLEGRAVFHSHTQIPSTQHRAWPSSTAGFLEG